MSRLAPALVTVVAAAYFALFLGYGLEVEDEGLILAQAERTLHGELPYVDFETGYTPGVFYLNAALLGLFGGGAIPVRLLLLVVNSLTIGLTFTLARPWAGTVLAAAVALGYAAFLPVFPGMFASFNVPYPSWYTLVGWLGTQAAMDRHLRRGGRATLIAAGLLAGITFAFKPNGGALALVACGLALALPAASDAHPDRRLARLLLVLAALAVLVLPVMDLELHFGDLLVGFALIAFPLLLLVLGRLLVARGLCVVPRRPAPNTASDGLATKIALVAGGALLPTLPWLVYFFWRLGPARFAREVLLLGLGFQGVFGTGYPIPFGYPGAWALVVAADVFAVAGLGLAAARRRTCLPWGLLALAGINGWLVLRFGELAHMPEGFTVAVVTQLQAASFLVVPPLAALGVLIALWRLRIRRMPAEPISAQPSGHASDRLLAMLAFATCLFLMLYPRIDSMHMTVALPSMLILGAAATRRVAHAWAGVLRVGPQWTIGALAGMVAMLAGLAAAPGIAAALAPTRIELPSTRLPFHVEAARGNELRDFGRILTFLEARLRTADAIFAFPALGLVSYALGRTFPVPYDYFFAGSPDHAQEATVLARLRAHPPRFIVTLNRRFGYFMMAPIYFFMLREMVQTDYALVARAGRFDVLERRVGGDGVSPPRLLDDDPQAAPATLDEAFAWMADFDRELRRSAVRHFLATAGDDHGVAALAARWAPDESRRLLLLRSLGEAGDERALPFLLTEIESGATPRVRGEAMSAFFILLLRDELAPHLFAGDGPAVPTTAWRALPLARFAADLRAGLNRSLDFVTITALGKAGYGEAAPVLERMLRESLADDPSDLGSWYRIALAEALVRLGRPEHLCNLVDLLGIARHEIQDLVPSFVIAETRRNRIEGTRCLARGLAAAAPATRAMSAYIAGQIPLPALAPELGLAADDVDPTVRAAGAWALARLDELSGE